MNEQFEGEQNRKNDFLLYTGSRQMQFSASKPTVTVSWPIGFTRFLFQIFENSGLQILCLTKLRWYPIGAVSLSPSDSHSFRKTKLRSDKQSLLRSLSDKFLTLLPSQRTVSRAFQTVKLFSVSTAAVSRNLRDVRQMVCVVSDPIGLTSLSDFPGTGNSSNRLSQTYGLHLCRLLPYHSN